MDKEMNRMAQLVVAKPQWEVNMAGLIKAAKLYLEGKTGEDAFCPFDRDGLKYAFIPLPTGDVHVSLDTRNAAIFLFGDALTQYPHNNQFLPYLLTCLCGDLLNEKTARTATYSSEDCGFVHDKNSLQIRFIKHIEYCSYHNISLSFTETRWVIEIEGCWRGSEGDSGGPVYHPQASSYQGQVKGSGNTISSHRQSGSKPNEGFALWGVDLTRLGVPIVKRKATV